MAGKKPTGFVLSDTVTVEKWPVKIHIPTDGGNSSIQTIRFDFTIPGRAELKEIFGADMMRAGLENPGDTVLGEADRMTDFLKRHITGWHGVHDEDGEPLEFSQDGLEQLLDWTFILTPAIKAFIEACRGHKAKN